MAKKPNNLPPWLMDNGEDEPASSPPPAQKPSSPKPITPPGQKPPQARASGPAPWLQGLDEQGEEAERSDMTAGASLNRDWLESGAFLADNVETNLTYDEWYARQVESKRERSIEEEIPDFVETDDVPVVAGAEEPAAKGTGMLPDWFLGMESLNPEEEPEWMRKGDTFTAEPEAPPAPPERDLPGWMKRSTDSFEATQIPKFEGFTGGDAAPADPDDAVTSFFNSLSGDEDELPPEFSASFGDVNPPAPTRPPAQVQIEPDFSPPGDDFDDALAEWNGGSITAEIASAAAAAGYETLPEAPRAKPIDPDSIDTLRELFGDLMDDESEYIGPAVTDPSMLPENVDALIAAGPDASWFDDSPQYASDTDELEALQRPVDTAILRDLEDFFGDVAATRAENEDDGGADPDLDWFLNEPDVSPTQMYAQRDPVAWNEDPNADPNAPVEEPAPTSENTLSWLSELNSIVNKATRSSDEADAFDSFAMNDNNSDDDDSFYGSPALPLSPSFEELGITPADYSGGDDDDMPEDTLVFSSDDLQEARDVRTKLRTSQEQAVIVPPDTGAFDWDNAEAAPDPEPIATDGINWLNAFDTETMRSAQAEQPPPASPDSPGFTGLLTRFAPPTPEPEITDDLAFGFFDANEPDQPARGYTPLDTEFVAPPVVGSMFDSNSADNLDDLQFPDLFGGDADENDALRDALLTDSLYSQTPDIPAAPTTDSSEFPSFNFEPEAPAEAPVNTDDLFASFQQFRSEAEIDVEQNMIAEAYAPLEPIDAALDDGDQNSDFFSLIQRDPTVNLLSDTEQNAADLQAEPATFDADELFAAFESGQSDTNTIEDDAETGGLYAAPTQNAEPMFDDLNFDADELFAAFESGQSDTNTIEDDAETGGLYAAPTQNAETTFDDLNFDADELFAAFETEQPAEEDSVSAVYTPPAASVDTDDSLESLFGLVNFDDEIDDETAQDKPITTEFDMPMTDDAFSTPIQDDQPAFDDDNFFASFEVEQPATNAIEASSIAPAADAQDEQPAFDDDNFFASFDLDSTETNDPVSQNTESASDADNFFTSLGVDNVPKREAQPDFFWDQAEPASPGDFVVEGDSFFDSLGVELPDEVVDEPAFMPASAEQSFEDLFPDPGNIPFDQPEPEPEASAAPAFANLDEYLSMLGTNDMPGLSPETQALLNQTDVDLDELFAKNAADRTVLPTMEGGDIAPGIGSEWLSDIQGSVGNVSATAILRQRKDRPEGELPDRLKRLRAREKQAEDKITTDEQPAPERRGRRRKAAEPQVPDALVGVLPGAPALAPTRIKPGAFTLAQSVVLTPDQQTNVDILRSLVRTGSETGIGRSNRLSAIDLTYDTPFLRDLEDNENSLVRQSRTDEAATVAASTAVPARANVRPRRRYDRLIVALVMILAMIAAVFVDEFQIAPPTAFVDAGSATAAFNAIDGIELDEYALIAVEYSPASAGELDAMTDAIMRHILLRGGIPVIISTNPFGVLRAENLLRLIDDDAAFLASINASGTQLVPNVERVITRYLAGSAIGLRSFSENPAAAFALDVEGATTGLAIRSLNDFAVLVLIADSADDVRAYAEQVAPMTDSPFTAVISYSASPVAETYTGTAGVYTGLLIGGQDATAYQTALAQVSPVQRTGRPELPAPPSEVVVPPSDASSMTGGNATGSMTESTPEVESNTGSITATITAEQVVNVRSGPGTTFGVVGQAEPGAQVNVIGFSDNSEWVNVRLEDDTEGWISAPLLRINERTSFKPGLNMRARRQGEEPPARTPRPTSTPLNENVTDEPTAETATARATNTPRATRTPAPTEETSVPSTPTDDVTATLSPSPTNDVTATPTASPTNDATAAPTATPITLTIDDNLTADDVRGRRWSVFNMGILASAAVITVGAAINIVRGLRRRRKND